MSLIQVNYGSLQAGESEIRSTVARLQSMFDDLQAQVSQLLPTWDGTARDSYYAVQQNWNRVTVELNTALQQMGVGVQTANSNFQSAESANTRGWG